MTISELDRMLLLKVQTAAPGGTRRDGHHPGFRFYGSGEVVYDLSVLVKRPSLTKSLIPGRPLSFRAFSFLTLLLFRRYFSSPHVRK